MLWAAQMRARREKPEPQDSDSDTSLCEFCDEEPATRDIVLVGVEVYACEACAEELEP